MPELSEAVRLLQQVRLFQGLQPRDLAEVARAARSVEVARGSFFFRQGIRAQVFYVLQRGRVKLTQVAPEGHQILLRFIGPGQIFGPTAALEGRLYPVSAQAACSCQALAWEGKTMIRLMESYPRIALNALDELSANIEELRERYRQLATERVERRVAHALLRLAEQAGWKKEEAVAIDMPVSRRDLAEMTGTTLYTVSRILSRWQRTGLVDTGRQRVAILRAQCVRAIAGELLQTPASSAASNRPARTSRSRGSASSPRPR
jgi:CRP-like cAMP-binding protein